MKTKINTEDNIVVRAAKTVWNGVVGFVKRVFASILESAFAAVQYIGVMVVAPSPKNAIKAFAYTARYLTLLCLVINPIGLIASPLMWAFEVALATVFTFIYGYAYLMVLRILAGLEEMIGFVCTAAALRRRIQEWAVA
ncbi:hypothetical protein CZP2022_143 [Vibrio phage C-ZP2022]|nr:hypothetical protein CZP2022_143 [Vibrio phage C-ZP2022]